MSTWKSNFEESKQHYLDWWNGKGIVLTMWEHIFKNGKPWEDIDRPAPHKDINQFWFDPD